MNYSIVIGIILALFSIVMNIITYNHGKEIVESYMEEKHKARETGEESQKSQVKHFFYSL